MPIVSSRRQVFKTRPIDNENGLVGWWTFDDTQANDLSGYSNNGTLSGATPPSVANSQGLKRGTSLNYNGSTAFVDIGAPSVLELYNSLSIMGWGYYTGGGAGYLISKDFSTGARGFVLGRSGTGQLYLEVSASVRFTSTGPSLVPSTWWHFAATNDNGTWTAYVNGVSIGTSAGGNPTANALAHWYISGRAYVGSFNPWQGLIDDVRVYKTPKSACEINAIYNSTRSIYALSPDEWEMPALYTNVIAFDAASNSGYQTAQSTYSWSHTCTGSDRYLTVGISMLSVAGSSVSSITYNGVAMSKIDAKASVSGAVRSELWGLVAPTSGTNTITVTLSASLDSIGEAVSFTQVHQTTPYEGVADASATNVGAADATVNVTTTADNDWTVDIVATDDTSITVGTGQTSQNNVSGTLGSGGMATKGPNTPAGSVTMNWTNIGALATWSIVSVALRPIAASGSSFLWWAQRNNIPILGTGTY